MKPREHSGAVKPRRRRNALAGDALPRSGIDASVVAHIAAAHFVQHVPYYRSRSTGADRRRPSADDPSVA